MKKEMIKKTYDNIYELCEDVVDTYDVLESNYDNNIVSIIAKYDEASLIVSELCTMDFSLFSCELHDPEFAGYTDEYLIKIIEDKIFCEPAKRNGDYICSDSSIVYVLDDCNSKALSKFEADYTYEVHLYDENDEDDMEYDCDGCIFCDECDEYDDHDEYGFLLDDCVDNKDMHGFSASKSNDYGYHSVSFYSTERVNHDDMMDLLRIFGL